MSTAADLGWRCGHCGRPVAAAVFIGHTPYHEECTHGPGWQPTYFTAPPPMLPSDDAIRAERDVLKNLLRRAMRLGALGFPLQRDYADHWDSGLFDAVHAVTGDCNPWAAMAPKEG